MKLKYLFLPALFWVTTSPAQSALSEHMDEHFLRATQVQTAIINADLKASREAAAWLADHQGADDFPENALDQMRAAAQAVVDAENIYAAGLGVGQIGAACGYCHELMSVQTGLKSDAAYELGSSLSKRMARHLWAVDRMWEGLIANSDQAWIAGAELLLEAPLSSQDISAEPQPAIDKIGQQIRELAIKARKAAKRGQRAELYGEFIARCASCHTAFRSD